MQRIKNPMGLFFIYLGLSLFILYSIGPFIWTALQSLKTVKQATARTPLFIFEPMFKNYSDLWLRSTEGNLGRVALVLIVILVALIFIGIFARRLPLPTRAIYGGIIGVIILILWAFPRFVDTGQFYDYFLNTIIVTVGVVIISISIGCLAGYALARYNGIEGVVILIAALAFRSLPSMGLLLPFYWLGRASGLVDSYVLVILVLVAKNQPFTIWLLSRFFMNIPREIESKWFKVRRLDVPCQPHMVWLSAERVRRIEAIVTGRVLALTLLLVVGCSVEQMSPEEIEVGRLFNATRPRPASALGSAR